MDGLDVVKRGEHARVRVGVVVGRRRQQLEGRLLHLTPRVSLAVGGIDAQGELAQAALAALLRLVLVVVAEDVGRHVATRERVHPQLDVHQRAQAAQVIEQQIPIVGRLTRLHLEELEQIAERDDAVGDDEVLDPTHRLRAHHHLQRLQVGRRRLDVDLGHPLLGLCDVHLLLQQPALEHEPLLVVGELHDILAHDGLLALLLEHRLEQAVNLCRGRHLCILEVLHQRFCHGSAVARTGMRVGECPCSEGIRFPLLAAQEPGEHATPAVVVRESMSNKNARWMTGRRFSFRVCSPSLPQPPPRPATTAQKSEKHLKPKWKCKAPLLRSPTDPATKIRTFNVPRGLLLARL